ncbi:hypothetical protein DL766_002762 [Monosporascus sp. MC13-8B]|uniref:AMP-dependent synthetase/ligase domain-containing protein n=1 Tax=Monosporascus cannonballus TaxID=155416 RepID=A0ABY0HJB7_9PEZI|nr:hypothetical protein DL762_000510 [Monosporascus cannonballus]RYO96021.1 hypothetical protein DL763_003413 [Monosporascus cannonballus]RYP34864.1 hypothetical protein DL766_002762 [Monosporascus sp. MC13-8B]
MHALWAGVDQVHVHAANVTSSPTTFLDLLSRHCVSRSFAPNFFLASLVSAATSATQQEGDVTPRPGAEKTGALWDLSSLTFLASGGEANDIKTYVEVSALLEKYGARRGVVAPGFGMTETCAGAIYNTECPEYDVASGYTIASLGKCIKGMEMRITVPKSGQVPATRVAQPNEPGDLEVQGDVVFQGYYRNPAATTEAFTADSWFRTGDRGMLDINGNLSLVGRVKEIVNINGVKVTAADIQLSLEQVIKGRGVARLIVFPSRAAHTEQITVAYMPRTWSRPVEDIAEIEHLLVQACMMAVTSRPLIFALSRESLPLLPTTTLGKISRAKMRSLLEESAFAADIAEHRSAVDGVRMRESNEECGEQQLQLENPLMSEAEAGLINDFVRTRGSTMTAESRLALVEPADIAKVAAVVLKHADDFHGRALGVAGDVLTVQEALTQLGAMTGLSYRPYFMSEEEIDKQKESLCFTIAERSLRFMADNVDLRELASMTNLTNFKEFLNREEKLIKETYL